jgi:hypothetical protein
MNLFPEVVKKKKGKAIPVMGSEGLLGCETPRIPHFLDNQFSDDGDVIRRKAVSSSPDPASPHS